MRFVISVALVAAVGCGDREIVELEKVRDSVCACRAAHEDDPHAAVQCAEAALKLLPKRETRASHRAQVIARDMMECLARLYEADKPSTDPDR
jgi:hypothetical protein